MCLFVFWSTSFGEFSYDSGSFINTVVLFFVVVGEAG